MNGGAEKNKCDLLLIITYSTVRAVRKGYRRF